MNEEQIIYIKCECGSEILTVEHVKEINKGVVWLDEFELCIFEQNKNNNTFWERVKYAFNYVIKGELWKDQIQISVPNAIKLANWLKDEASKKIDVDKNTI